MDFLDCERRGTRRTTLRTRWSGTSFARNERTGDLTHPSLVYVVGQDGKIAYAITGSEPVIRAAVEAL